VGAGFGPLVGAGFGALADFLDSPLDAGIAIV
jgi:hypothetical protein